MAPAFLALQKQAFSPKNFKFHAGFEKYHFGNFSVWSEMAMPCQCGPQESFTGIQNKFFLVANQSLERLEGKTKQKGPISFKGSIWLNTSVLRDVHMMIVRNAENFEKGRKLCVIFPSLKNIDRFPTVQNKHTVKKCTQLMRKMLQKLPTLDNSA